MLACGLPMMYLTKGGKEPIGVKGMKLDHKLLWSR